MKITKRHPFENRSVTMDLPITPEQWNLFRSGVAVQKALPHLSADEREFLISGIPPGEWDKWIPNPNSGEPDDEIESGLDSSFDKDGAPF